MAVSTHFHCYRYRPKKLVLVAAATRTLALKKSGEKCASPPPPMGTVARVASQALSPSSSNIAGKFRYIAVPSNLLRSVVLSYRNFLLAHGHCLLLMASFATEEEEEEEGREGPPAAAAAVSSGFHSIHCEKQSARARPGTARRGGLSGVGGSALRAPCTASR